VAISEFYAAGMAARPEYFCEERPGYDTEITDHLNSRAAEGWELVTAQVVVGDRPPHFWLIWRR